MLFADKEDVVIGIICRNYNRFVVNSGQTRITGTFKDSPYVRRFSMSDTDRDVLIPKVNTTLKVWAHYTSLNPPLVIEVSVST